MEKLRLYSDPACADLLRAAAAAFRPAAGSGHAPATAATRSWSLRCGLSATRQHPLAYADITYGCYGVWCGLLHIPMPRSSRCGRISRWTRRTTMACTRPSSSPTPTPPPALPCRRERHRGHPAGQPRQRGHRGRGLCGLWRRELRAPASTSTRTCWWCRPSPSPASWPVPGWVCAMGNAKLIADLNRVKFSLNPYNINRLTLKAGQAALEDTAYFDLHPCRHRGHPQLDEAAAGSPRLCSAGQPVQLPVCKYGPERWREYYTKS